MIQSKAKVSYESPTDLTATAAAAFKPQPLAALAGVTDTFPGTLQLMMANVGANDALFYLTVGNKTVAAVNGMPLKSGPSNPIIIPDLDPKTVLMYKSTAGTTIEVQVGKVSG